MGLLTGLRNNQKSKIFFLSFPCLKRTGEPMWKQRYPTTYYTFKENKSFRRGVDKEENQESRIEQMKADLRSKGADSRAGCR